ncbi:MAG: hypothetical protein IJ638_02665 [Alphaproteobacteria bacterium]|nr:hypothetical protein [Alphaproteobacteria bacterium]
MKKITNILNNIISIVEITDNELWEIEYDRLDNTGSFTANEILQNLKDRNISDKKTTIEVKRINEMAPTEINKILNGMNIADLKVLLLNIQENDIAKNKIAKIIKQKGSR